MQNKLRLIQNKKIRARKSGFFILSNWRAFLYRATGLYLQANKNMLNQLN
jgi:hypothetical protein